MPRASLRLGLISSPVLAVLACVPARLGREVASFQRELDVELVEALEPRTSAGLEAACHRDPILWMHFLVTGEDWRLLSVDERGQAAIWSARGLEQTWSLRDEELEWVRRVVTRQHLSEDADWLYARALKPGDECRSQFCASPTFDDIAPRNDHSWLGVGRWRTRNGNHRITASGDWYAIGDGAGNLSVARTGRQASQVASLWGAPACEDLRWANMFELNGEAGIFVTNSDDRYYRRFINVRWGLHSLVFSSSFQHRYEAQYEVGDLELGPDRSMAYEDGPRASKLLRELFIAEPDLAWLPLRYLTLSADQRWLAVAGEREWVIHDRVDGTTRRVEFDPDRRETVAAISSRGTLAIAGWAPQRFVELHPVEGKATMHLLPASPVELAFVQDTLWIGVAEQWKSFVPLDTRLLRLEPGGVPMEYPVPGFETIERVLGSMPGSVPTLVVFGGGVIGIVRLTDGALLRVVVRDLGIRVSYFPDAVWRPDGLSLIWLDAAGERRCRYDGTDDDHALSREARIANADNLLRALLSGSPCPQ